MENKLGHLLQHHKGVKLLEIILVFLAAALLVLLSYPLAGENPFLRQALLWLAYLAMFGLIMWGLRLRGQNLQHFGIRFSRWTGSQTGAYVLKSIILFFIALIVFILAGWLMMQILPAAEPPDMSRYNYLEGRPWRALGAWLSILVISSFGEEFIFRAFLMNRIAELGHGSRMAWYMAILISAIIFGLIHYSWGPAGIVQTFGMGLVLGAGYVYFKKDLWPNILAHVYMDTLLVLQMYLGASAQ